MKIGTNALAELFLLVVKMSLVFVKGNTIASSIKVCINFIDGSDGLIVVYFSCVSVSANFC